MGPKLRLRHIGLTAALIALLLLTACRVVRGTVALPGRSVRAVTTSSSAPANDPAELQAALQRFADEFLTRTTAALAEYARRVDTPEARTEALARKIPVASAAIGIASGPNPMANLLDMVTLAKVTRLATEELASSRGNPDALQPWCEVSRSLETNAWTLASGVLTPAQQEELSSTIQRWWEAHADARSAFFARPQELSCLIVATGSDEAVRRPGSVFGLVGLDPTAGLDPAVREVTRTRLFAERTLFTAQRMPFLLRWQMELLGDQLLRHAEVSAALTNATRLADSAERLSRAAESASQTAAQLPDRVVEERKAIIAALEEQEGRLRELSAELGRALAAGSQMSTSINTTLITFDALMKRFGVGETNRVPANPNSQPFNILDYARTAEQMAVTAQELGRLLRETDNALDSPALDRRLQQLDAVAERAKSDAKAVLNHAFLLGAGLLLLLLAGALAYRWIVSRWLPGSTTRPADAG
ncbi:MAG TPA: hypothetical protein PLX89_26115 [Verrucomicrobiota bacterium]|nr:hypothetical protein [Verrucomicrobiales bacterium]HRI16485.1 hypothetical protein [Verrucomicrobiota bacterium]